MGRGQRASPFREALGMTGGNTSTSLRSGSSSGASLVGAPAFDTASGRIAHFTSRSGEEYSRRKKKHWLNIIT